MKRTEGRLFHQTKALLAKSVSSALMKEAPGGAAGERAAEGAGGGGRPESETQSIGAKDSKAGFAAQIERLLEKPRNPSFGHIALPVFPFAKQLKKAPQDIAREWEKKLRPGPLFDRAQAIGGFLNFSLSPAFLKSQLEAFCKGAPPSFGGGEHWALDFASPNVAKDMTMGHFRAGLIGQSIANMARHFGFKVTAINHLGDWGTQFGKLLWAYQKWGAGGKLPRQKAHGGKKAAASPQAETAGGSGAAAARQDSGAAAEKEEGGGPSLSALSALYSRFHKEETAAAALEAKALFKRLEGGDPALLSLWRKFVSVSLKDYSACWAKLAISHDLIQGESFYKGMMEGLKARLSAKGILQKSEGALAVFLPDSPPCLIEKSDGASTYAARDLASAIWRIERLKAQKLIYITGSDQILHFRQIFQTLDKMGINARPLHLPFGMYLFKGEKMSSRGGKGILLKDTLKEAHIRAGKIIEGRDLPKAQKERIAEQAAIGALVFQDLSTDRVKDVDFDWERALDFEGSSGPFVQYAYVRAGSLLRKYGKKPPQSFSEGAPSPSETRLMWKALYFDEAAYQAFTHFKPHILAGFALEFAQEFNRFYASERVIGSDREGDKALLIQISRHVLKQVLSLLNMPRPEAL